MGYNDPDWAIKEVYQKKDLFAPESTEKETKIDLEYRHITDAIAKELELPEIPPVDLRTKAAGLLIEESIKKDLIKHEGWRNIVKTLGKIASLKNLPEHNPSMKEPEGRQGKSTWAKHTRYFMNGNRDIFRMASKEIETHDLKNRFSVVVPVNEQKPDIDIQDVVYKIFREKDEEGKENPKAFGWDKGDGETVQRTYNVNVLNKEDVAVIDLNQSSWDQLPVIDVRRIHDKIVFIKNDAGIEPTPAQEMKMKFLLKGNRFVIRQIQDPKVGPTLEAVMNHNWTDAAQMKVALCQIAEEAHGGTRLVEKDEEWQEILDKSNARYNFGRNNQDGAIQAKVLQPELVQQINDLYDQYQAAFPDADTVRSLFTKPDEIGIFINLKYTLGKARFLQLLVQRAAGVEKNKVKGSILKFDSNINKELDQFEVDGSFDDIKKHLEEANSQKGPKAAQALRRIAQILEFYNKDKSNIEGRIKEVFDVLPTPAATADMVEIAINSRSAEYHSGQVMTSFAPLTEAPEIVLKKRSEEGNSTKKEPQGIMTTAVASSAHTDFIHTSVSIVAEEEGRGLDSKFKRIILSAKANRETGKKRV